MVLIYLKQLSEMAAEEVNQNHMDKSPLVPETFSMIQREISYRDVMGGFFFYLCSLVVKMYEHAKCDPCELYLTISHHDFVSMTC